MVEVDEARARDLDGLGRLRRKPSTRQHRGMFDRRHQQPLDLLSRPPPQPRGQRERVGLGAAGAKDDVLRPRPDRRSNGGPRVLNQPAGLPALGVNRGRIAAQLPRVRHRLPRVFELRADRSGQPSVVLRLAVGNLRTTEQHVARAWELLTSHSRSS